MGAYSKYTITTLFYENKIVRSNKKKEGGGDSLIGKTVILHIINLGSIPNISIH